MAKAAKSSASSGTRKKNARKAAKSHGDDTTAAAPGGVGVKKKKGKKGEKVEPRQKVYIPPVKPSAPRPDPLDAMGLAAQLPADLVVVLRLLGKKDAVSKQRGLDELQSGWVGKACDDEYVGDVVERMLPVWVSLSFNAAPSLLC